MLVATEAGEHTCLAESGVNPEALAAVVKELRREAAALRQAERCEKRASAISSPMRTC
jgi:hypothetical protein